MIAINVCVNGTFRYNQYARYYHERGALGSFYFSHRRSTGSAQLGLPEDKFENLWLKEYVLYAAQRIPLLRGSPGVYTRIGELWQSAVIRRWRDCDSVEAVTGGVADRILQHAKTYGAKTLGHPVNSHPQTYSDILSDEYRRLGLRTGDFIFPDMDRRLREIELCDKLIVDSHFVRRSFIDNGFPGDRIHVVAPGSDTLRFAPRLPHELDRKVFRVVCVGAITARKGQRYLLEAWRKLSLPNAELVLVGAATAEAWAVTRGFEDSFVHIPHIPNAELRKLLVTASAFVLPSIEDGFAQSPMEALSCGVPTIVTTNNGTADVISEGKNGFVVAPQSADALADRLEFLYANRDTAEEIGVYAGAHSLEAFSWNDYVGRVVAIHQALTDRPI